MTDGVSGVLVCGWVAGRGVLDTVARGNLRESVSAEARAVKALARTGRTYKDSKKFLNPDGILHIQLVTEAPCFSSTAKVQCSPYMIGIPLAASLWVEEPASVKPSNVSCRVLTGPT